jgi:galactitol PTS system EIIA component
MKSPVYGGFFYFIAQKTRFKKKTLYNIWMKEKSSLEIGFSKDMVFIDPLIPETGRDAVIKYLCERLTEQGYITDDYLDEVLKRERIYPTGLSTIPYACAVPHANPIGVNKTGIALAVLKNPVMFCSMDDPKKELNVHLIFLMCFLGGNEIAMLQWISSVISNQQVVRRIAEGKTRQDVFKIIQPFLKTQT